MTQHLHLALQQLTIWFICQLLLFLPPAVLHLYILYVAPWVEITIPLLLFSLWSIHILVSSPESLMQPKTWLNPVSELCPNNTHTPTPTPILLLVYSNSQFQSRVKVDNALYSHRVFDWVFDCSFLCLSLDSDRRKRKKQDFVWDTKEPEGPTQGYPNRPQNSPKAAPNIEEQLWPLLVTLWISHTVSIDFSHWLCQQSEVI